MTSQFTGITVVLKIAWQSSGILSESNDPSLLIMYVLLNSLFTACKNCAFCKKILILDCYKSRCLNVSPVDMYTKNRQPFLASGFIVCFNIFLVIGKETTVHKRLLENCEYDTNAKNSKQNEI